MVVTTSLGEDYQRLLGPNRLVLPGAQVLLPLVS